MPNEIVVNELRRYRRGNSLQAFATLQLASGVILRGCTYHERGDGARWVGLPARQYTKQDGTTSWVRVIDFADRAARSRFQKQAKQAIDRYLEQQKAKERAKQAPVADRGSADSTMISDATVDILEAKP